MNSGGLNRRLTILLPVDTQNAIGEVTDKTYTTIKTVWAQVNPIQGREYFAADKWNSIVTHRVIMRYNGTLTPKHILRRADGKEYQIVSVVDLADAQRALEIYCYEVTT